MHGHPNQQLYFSSAASLGYQNDLPSNRLSAGQAWSFVIKSINLEVDWDSDNQILMFREMLRTSKGKLSSLSYRGVRQGTVRCMELGG